MDFTTEQMDQGLSGLSILTGADHSAISSISQGAQQSFIATNIGGILNSQDITRYPDGDRNNPVVQASQRSTVKETLQAAIANRTPASANALRDIGMAHYIWLQQNGREIPHNITFAHSDEDLSAAELHVLEGIVSHYDAPNDIQLTNTFRSASAMQTHSEQRQQLDAIDAANRAADMAYVKEGLQILGYIPDDVTLDDITDEQLKDGLYRLTNNSHMGLQTQGAAFDYAQAQYGTANIDMQEFAMYEGDSVELGDSRMARAIVETALETQNGIPATLLSPGGGINYSAVYAAADHGGLIPVPDEYLTAEQQEIFTALGGQTSEAGQLHLVRMIEEDNGAWYGEGLKQHNDPILALPEAAVLADAQAEAAAAGFYTEEQVMRHNVMTYEAYTESDVLNAQQEELVATSLNNEHAASFDSIYDTLEAGTYLVSDRTPPEVLRMIELQEAVTGAENALQAYRLNPQELNTDNPWGVQITNFAGLPNSTIVTALENEITEAQNNFLEYHNGLTTQQHYTVAGALFSDDTAVAAIDPAQAVHDVSDETLAQSPVVSAGVNVEHLMAPTAGTMQFDSVDDLQAALRAQLEEQTTSTAEITIDYQAPAPVSMEAQTVESTSPNLVSDGLASSNVSSMFLDSANGEAIHYPQSTPANMSTPNAEIMSQFSSATDGAPQQSAINPDIWENLQAQTRQTSVSALTH